MERKYYTGLDFIDKMRDDTLVVDKGWGFEIYINNTPFYCGKFLVFYPNKKCSLHMHKEKNEIFLCLQGRFKVLSSFHPEEETYERILTPGDTFNVVPNLYHQMLADPIISYNFSQESTMSVLLEISSEHKDEDSYRLIKGD